MPTQTELKCLEAAFEIQFGGMPPQIIEKEEKKRLNGKVNDALQRSDRGLMAKGEVKKAVDE